MDNNLIPAKRNHESIMDPVDEQSKSIKTEHIQEETKDDHKMDTRDDAPRDDLPKSLHDAQEQVDQEDDDEEDQKQDKKVVTIRKLRLVAQWSYDVQNDQCAICHNSIEIPCIKCEAEPARLAEKCTIAWGTCQHCYHAHCILDWLRKRSTCPLDDQEWEMVKNE